MRVIPINGRRVWRAGGGRRGWLRRAMFQLHLWSGVCVGAFLFVVCLTGSMITFRGEIEEALRPVLFRVEPGDTTVPAQELWDAVAERWPDASLHTFNMPPEGHRAWSIWMHTVEGRSAHAHLNRYTGEILGLQLADHNLTEWLYELHANLLGGRVGQQVNGLFGLVLLLLCVTGLVIWWPRRRDWIRRGLTIQWQAQWKRRNYDLHRVVGVVTSLLVALIALTGVFFPYPEPFRWVAEKVTGTIAHENTPASRSEPIGTRIPLDAALAAATVAMPEGEINWVSLPREPGDVFSVRKRLPGEWRLEGMNHIHVDAYTGEVLRVDRHAERTAGQRLIRAMFPLHTGTFWGLPTRILWTVVGLAPALLFVTGFLMWWNRVIRPRRRRMLAAFLRQTTAACAATGPIPIAGGKVEVVPPGRNPPRQTNPAGSRTPGSPSKSTTQ